MRAFVAVFPPSEVSSALSTAIRDLDVGDEVRWVPAANVHLTLKFLGNVAVEDLEHVKLALDTVATRHAPFEATPSEFGAFPNGRRARILWAGIGEGSERLRALAHDIEDRLAPLGFERERPPLRAAPHPRAGPSPPGKVRPDRRPGSRPPFRGPRHPARAERNRSVRPNLPDTRDLPVIRTADYGPIPIDPVPEMWRTVTDPFFPPIADKPKGRAAGVPEARIEDPKRAESGSRRLERADKLPKGAC